MARRRVEETIAPEPLDGACHLRSEDKPDRGHRRLVAEYLRSRLGRCGRPAPGLTAAVRLEDRRHEPEAFFTGGVLHRARSASGWSRMRDQTMPAYALAATRAPPGPSASAIVSLTWLSPL